MKKEASIAASQPSDCHFLQRDHIQCSEVNELTVWFGYKFTESINGPCQSQPTNKWKKALHYLLDTYRPSKCHFNSGNLETGIDDHHSVKLEDETLYLAYWNRSKTVLVFRRWVLVVLNHIRSESV